MIISVFQIVSVSAESSMKFKMPSIQKGHDFTKIAAGAEYKPGELLVRFAPRADWSEQAHWKKNKY
jgi:hypothetical protein